MSRIPVDKPSNIPPEKRWNNENESAPPPTYNAGLYSGAPFKGPWGNIPTIPTTAYMIHHNLRSANPPPGAIYQYPGTIRCGNNYMAMPGVVWYTNTPVGNEGPYLIQITEK